ncbi:MAG: hypothetical protein GF353_28140 [Candidatus Lokiarchaeota archaeon]|nr:hypothetical protein [Candidatus Lokiarchaeota archaeon]
MLFLRILISYFSQSGAKLIITHSFIKKSQKTPRKEIERAKELRGKYNQRCYR